MEELRIKSNDDLHNLWYVLVKERNMLMTMQEEAKRQLENMPSPERIDKVEESMKNIEEVIKERNKAYYQLEVGDDQYVERRRAFRRDQFGRWRWIGSSEHLIPYSMNSKWRNLYGPGFGKGVAEFNRALREKKFNKQVYKTKIDEWKVRQYLRRFPHIDLEYLQEIYPDVDVAHMKENLREYLNVDRTYRINGVFYKKNSNL